MLAIGEGAKQQVIAQIGQMGTNLLTVRPQFRNARGYAGAIATATVAVDGSGMVTVVSDSTPQGQGHRTVLAQIVADQLGVRLEDVHVTTGDTRRMAYAVGTFASRGAVMSGNAVALAAKLKAQGTTAIVVEAER